MRMLAIAAMVAACFGGVATSFAQGPELALVQVTSQGAERPIRLAQAKVAVVVDGTLARTTVDLTLVNPNARVLEGELQFPLRAGQTVTGFALDMADGSMRAAVPVPKARGRAVFEEIVRRGVDPALLEQTAGDNFRLRVYPLRPGGARHVRVEISEQLAADASGQLRLAPPLDFNTDALDLEVQVHGVGAGVHAGTGLAGAALAARDGGSVLTLHRDAFRAAAGGARASTLAWAAPQGDTLLAERSVGEAWFNAEVSVPAQFAPRARPDEVTVIWDASGSGAKRDHAAELRLLDALFAWQPDVRVRLRVVRDAAEPDRLFDVRHGAWQALRDALGHVAYDGASNASLWTPPAGGSKRGLALLFSDGLGDWGGAAPRATGGVPAYAVQSANGGSATFLRQWAESRGGRLLDLTTASPDAALKQLQQVGTRLVRIDGSGFDQGVAASWRPEGGRVVVAGRLTAAAAQVDLVLETADGATQHKRFDIAAPATSADTATPGFVAQRWARLRADELLAEPELHRTELLALGNRFGIVTPETSLIVLETLADYQRYELQPPPGPLRAAWDAAQRESKAEKTRASARQVDSLVERWRAVQAWWDKDFPKSLPAPLQVAAPAQISQAFVADAPVRSREALAATADAASAGSPPTPRVPAPMPAPAMAAPPVVMASVAPAAEAAARPRRDARSAANDAFGEREEAKAKKSAGDGSAQIHIAVQGWTPEAGGMRRLQRAAAADRYAVYLDLRQAAPDSPAFYLDAAQVFAGQGQKALALRVLSNLAELHIEDRGLLRVLAYRLQEIGETAEAIRLLERVTVLAPDEPQSWRDLGLAQAAAGAWQASTDSLWMAASGSWDGRFGDIDVIALGELNAIAAQHPVDVRKLDKRLRRNLPLDLRVALAWDTDNTDIDLWVKDPLGEWVSYQAPLSHQGGRVTRDVTQGYGPEVFSLKKAVPGTYEVRARYYGSHRQALGNGTSVMMRLSTGFGTTHETHRDVILRLEEAKDDMLVGTFEVN